MHSKRTPSYIYRKTSSERILFSILVMKVSCLFFFLAAVGGHGTTADSVVDTTSFDGALDEVIASFGSASDLTGLQRHVVSLLFHTLSGCNSPMISHDTADITTICNNIVVLSFPSHAFSLSTSCVEISSGSRRRRRIRTRKPRRRQNLLLTRFGLRINRTQFPDRNLWA